MVKAIGPADRANADFEDGDGPHRVRATSLRRFLGRGGPAAIVLVAVVGSVVVGSGAWYWHARNVSETREQLRTTSADVSADVTRTLLQYGNLVSGSAALFHQGVVSRGQYDAYLQALGFGSAPFQGLLGAGLIQVVPAGDVPGFLASLQAEGISVTSIAPAGERSQYCLGSYADWSKLNVTIPLYGYDFCTVPALFEVLARATSSGQQQVIAGSTLGPLYKSDFVLVQPVYNGTPASASERDSQVTGWALAIVNGPGLLKSIALKPGVQFLVSSGTPATRHAESILRSPASVKNGSSWAVVERVSAYGPWTIRLRAGPGFPETGGGWSGPTALLVLGLLAVGLLAALMASQSTSRSRALGEVDRATRRLRSSEQRFRTLVGSSSDLIAVVNDKAELIYANPAAHRLLGLDPEEHEGRNMLELVHPDDFEAVVAAFSRDISVPGIHPPAVYRFRAAAGEWRYLEVTATNCLDDPSIAALVINARDVTEQTNLTRALRTLGQASHALVHASGETSLLVDTCKTIVEAGGYRLAWVGYVEHDVRCTVRPVASSGELKYLNEVHVSWADNEYGKGPIGKAIRTGTVQVAEDLPHTRGVSAESLAAVARYGFRTNCVLPLEVGGEVIGALAIYAAELGAFGPSEVRLFTELGAALAYGISRLRDADSLQASEERFRVLASSSPIGILEVSSTRSVEYVNSRAAEISGRVAEELMGMGWIDAVHPDDRPALLAIVERARSNREDLTTKFRILRPDGEVRHVRMSASASGAKLDDGYVVTVEDVTEEVVAQHELAHQAFHDSLTGLPNRALFLDRLNQELARQRREGSKIAVLFLDLDQFKIVNDSLGHETGDAVLKEVGARFMSAVRAGETAARFSGDEFIFIVRHIREVQDSIAAAKRILALLEQPIHYAGQDLRVSGSIGIVIPSAGMDAGTILRDADAAMYKAKEAGRNTCALFDEDLHHRSVARLEMESELRKALVNEEFQLYFQPAVEPSTGRPLAAEALIRWHHPTRGLVPPLEFIPVAEDSGLIKPIGNWVFEHAMSQLASWDALEDGPRLHVLSVNLSARQLDDPETPRMVGDVLDRYGIEPIRAALEITESVVMEDNVSTRSSLRIFKDLGLQVAIDDFGTGYSSLAYLHTLPVTTVKIDRSFVCRLGGEDDSTPVIRAIVEMSHAMGLGVVAEGVESEHQRTLVSEMGCDLAQGFLWARPMPADEFVSWWRDAERQVQDRRVSGRRIPHAV